MKTMFLMIIMYNTKKNNTTMHHMELIVTGVGYLVWTQLKYKFKPSLLDGFKPA